MIQAFLKDDSGATAIEYGFIAGLFSIAILVSVTTLGASIDGTYAFINVAIQ
jgi:pilus assembly protein Flp/PilA